MPELDSICQRCGDVLPSWARPLGVCGSCLSAASRPVSRVPGPGYAWSKPAEAEGPGPMDITFGDEEAVG